MFRFFRKHQKWLLLIVAIVVGCFVVYFSPTQRMSGGTSGRVDLGTIFGEPVRREDYRDARAEVDLHYRLSRGEWPDRDPGARQMGFDLEREIYYRLLLTQKQRELNIRIGNDAIGRLAGDVLRSFQRVGVNSLEDFEQGILRPRGLTVADFKRIMTHELAVQHMVSLFGLSGRLVTPGEAELLFRDENEQVVCEAAIFTASNYLGSVTVAPEGLAQFYTNQMPSYRLPERVQVSYVKFDPTNFLAEADQQIAKVTNFIEIVEAAYLKRGTNFYSESTSPEEAKEKIKEEIRQTEAVRAARKQAVEFAGVVFDLEPPRAENLEKVAAERGLTVKVTAPFGEETGPGDLEVFEDFAQAAFKLTPLDQPFAGPIITGTNQAVYVIALKQRFPSENPPFESVRDRVTADYKLYQATELAHDTGTAFAATLTNAPTASRTFSNLCAEARVEWLPIPPFSLATRGLTNIENRLSLGQLQNVAFRLSPGSTSTFIPTTRGGFVLYLHARVPADEQKTKQELPSFMAFLRQTRQTEAFNAWFRKQATEGLQDTPLARPRPATDAPTR